MRWLLACMLVLSLGVSAGAVEKLPLEEVDIDRLITDTQKEINQPNGVSVVWFLPETAFFRVLTEGAELPESQREEMRALLQGKCVVAIVRAHIGVFGGFTFFDKETVLRGTTIAVAKGDDKPLPMHLLEDVPTDLTLIVNAIKPIFANAIGRMGENMHFFVYDNRTPDGTKIYDPYASDEVVIAFEEMGRLPAHKSRYDTICDSLFKPRFCKNGKRAHVSWKYDPWTGEKLPE